MRGHPRRARARARRGGGALPTLSGASAQRSHAGRIDAVAAGAIGVGRAGFRGARSVRAREIWGALVARDWSAVSAAALLRWERAVAVARTGRSTVEIAL